MQISKSKIDASANYVETVDLGTLEARYVQRSEDYFIAYISSQTGCNQACRMCHLTATGQTKMRDATLDEMIGQAELIMAHHYWHERKAKRVHFNFMARGEPLNNHCIRHDNQALFGDLSERAAKRGLESRFLISTILPKKFSNTLVGTFGDLQPHIYYSLYSMRLSFRKRWLPKAMDPRLALEQLRAWADYTRNPPKVHYAFIQGENDDPGSVEEVCNAMLAFGLKLDVNIVRYNPYSPKQGQEPPEETIQRNAEIMRDLLGSNVRVIPKVGFDVKASCGMFVDSLSLA